MLLYPESALQKLDFPFILKELEHLCSGSLGRELLQRQGFLTDIEMLNEQLHFVKEAKDILENDAHLPQYGFNTLDFLQKLSVERYYLDVSELVATYYTLSAAAEVFRYFSPKSRQQLYPFLSAHIGAFQLEFGLIAAISRIIDPEKEIVRENASVELAQIRRRIQSKLQEIQAAFRRALAQYRQQQFLADTEETVREGRRVLSVKAEYKRSVKGMITDESENGNITYIEPQETVLLNNELTELYLEERKEIHKILVELSSRLRPHKQQIESLQLMMAGLDVVRAKAYFAIRFRCTMPEIAQQRKIWLREFVHPVLFYHHQKQHKPVVDNTLLLDEEHRMIVISGPNAGGKSIILKSVGLIQLMFQFGMLIPAKEGSALSVFEELFVDIGDEQSIENDLSTYSSHLSNMRYFISKAGVKTLVLMDEMGMGTDPALGGPMAEAVLENLHQKKVFGVLTTHFNNLKVFAAQTPNMLSGAMAFDTRQLKPLYQLQTGQPGSSFTFEIARKSGLPEYIIKRAELKVGENKKVLDEVLSDIQVEKQYIRGLRKNVQVKESQLQDLTKSYEQLNKELVKEKKKLLRQYEARLLERFNEESRTLEKEMRAWKENKEDKTKFLKVRGHIDQNRELIEKKLDDAPAGQPLSLQAIRVGSMVRLEEGTEVGQVLDIKNKQALVAFGNIQTKVKLHQLVPVETTQKSETTSRGSYSSKILLEKSEFDYNLDIRGLMKDEALTAIDNFMDKAVMYGIRHLKIIHGRGTGALKQAVQYYLKHYPHVQSYRYESEQFGGDGITIVEMK